MQVRLGVIMDPIQTIHIKKDSTFAMLLAAQQRGWSIAYMELKDLFLQSNVPWARMRNLTVRDKTAEYFQLGEEKNQQLDSLNIILMRKDPPVDMEYIYATQILELAERLGVLIVNKPQSLRDFNEKLFVSWFPQCCPPTLVSSDKQKVKDFLQQQEDIICKPLDLMGGQLVFRLQKADPNINVIIEALTNNGRNYLLAQRYLPEVKQGDKRVLLINGEPIPYALARVPQAGETRANLAVGGQGKGVALTERDKWICQQVGPVLREKGIFFAGIDIIGDYLTEINITSPTCIRELDAIYGLDISADLLDSIAKGVTE